MDKGKKSKTRRKTSKTLNKKYDEKYIQYRSSGERFTLEDSGTKLFVKAKCKMRSVRVDGGILPNMGHEGHKCDFLCENLEERQVHLIEMKHVLLDEVYNRLNGTPEAIKQYTKYGGIFEGLDRLDAYIVSPGAQKIPDANRNRECTELCRMLAKYSRKRVDDISKLLNYVKVVQKNAGQSSIEGRILCSNDRPLEF